MDKLRKHVSQMTREEVARVMTAVGTITPVLDRRHLQQRMTEKAIGPADILRAVYEGELIEVSYDGLSVRAVLRHGWCTVALNLLNGHVVSAWRNNPRDHMTVNPRLYNWDADILAVL